MLFILLSCNDNELNIFDKSFQVWIFVKPRYYFIPLNEIIPKQYWFDKQRKYFFTICKEINIFSVYQTQ